MAEQMRISLVQKAAVIDLHEHGGAGIIDPQGHVMAGGERIKGGIETWRTITKLGLATQEDNYRLTLTEQGHRKAREWTK